MDKENKTYFCGTGLYDEAFVSDGCIEAEVTGNFCGEYESEER